MKKNKYDLFLVYKKLKKNKLLSSLSTLNDERKKIELIKKTITEVLIETNNNSSETSASELKFNANFRQNLMQKLEVSNNRENHLLNEINNNLVQIEKIDKQKEKIKERKKFNDMKNQKLIELKNDNYLKAKNPTIF